MCKLETSIQFAERELEQYDRDAASPSSYKRLAASDFQMSAHLWLMKLRAYKAEIELCSASAESVAQASKP